MMSRRALLLRHTVVQLVERYPLVTTALCYYSNCRVFTTRNVCPGYQTGYATVKISLNCCCYSYRESSVTVNITPPPCYTRVCKMHQAPVLRMSIFYTCIVDYTTLNMKLT